MTVVAGPSPHALVVCIGNPDRGDDGFGALVARGLAGRLPAGVELVAPRADILSLLDMWVGLDLVVCVDAAAPMGAPGRIHRLDLTQSELPRDLSLTSSHGFGLPEAIALGRVLGRLPRKILVYAVEGARFDLGGAPSTAVTDAACKVAEAVAADVS